MKTYRRIFKNLASTNNLLISKLPVPEHQTGFHRNTEPRPARKQRLFPSRPKLVSATAALAMIGMSHAASVAVSVDFTGGTQTSTLTAPQVAGVVPATNWQTALGLSGMMPAADDSAAVPLAATVRWTAPVGANITGNPGGPLADVTMMQGYLGGNFSGTGATVPAQVRFTSIDLVSLGWASYDILVYSDSGKGNQVELSAVTTPSPIFYSHNELLPGFGTGVGTTTFVDSQSSPAGNYVRFSGLTGTAFTVRAIPLPGSDIAAINGIQIVQGVPEPSTSLLAILSTSFLIFRRKRS